MKLVSRKMMVVGAVAVFAGSAVIAPSIASAKAKTYKLKGTAVCKADSAGNFSGTVSANKPFGKGKCGGKLVVPNATITFKLKGGTLTYKSKSTLVNGKFHGKMTFTKGTGKFKGAKGKGTSVVDPTTGKAVFSGTVKF